ncbi:MAG: AraC family transcriptional regulator [Clostridiales bacterium]|jgi:AraC-like DNA-binding protein|nr:AraC family transcriptional regulator [Clostridiales bacterium]
MGRGKIIKLNHETTFYYELAIEPAQQTFYSHCHNAYEIILFIDGDGDYFIENNIYSPQKNDLFIVKPAQYHFLRLNSCKKYERFIINFSENLIPEHLIPFLRTGKQLFHLNENRALADRFFTLDECAKTFDDEDIKLFFRSFLHELIVRLKNLNAPNEKNTAISLPLLDNAIHYINEHISAPLSLRSIAQALFVSESTLAHAFPRYLNVSIMKYVRSKKILYGQSLIQSGIKPTKACQMCGFATYIAFYKAYKTILNTTPEHDLPRKNSP